MFCEVPASGFAAFLMSVLSEGLNNIVHGFSSRMMWKLGLKDISILAGVRNVDFNVACGFS